jgi:hypothetical protein
MDKHLDAEALSDYAEGLPDAHARAAADAHLAGCAQCRRELADIQAYFRNLSDLEPVRAPADFLSRVRSRLPRPSPWERAWASLLIPFRFIPVPIAVGVIIGITAITVYMRQGGTENRTVVPAPVPAPAAGPASGSTEPAAEGNSPALQPALKDEESAEVGSSVSKTPSAAPARLQKSLSRKPQAFRDEPASSAFTSPAPVGSRDAKQSPAKTAPAPVRQTPTEASQKLHDVEVEGRLDNPSAVYILNNSSAPANLPLDKTMPVEEKTAVPGQAEAAAGQSAVKRKEEERSNEADDQVRTAHEKKAAPAQALTSGYALSLRTKDDTAAVLAGLRSMGVEAEPEYASPEECRFRLIVPAPMLRELGPYLARHGESRPEGKLPVATNGAAFSMRLRLLYPVR